MIVNPGSHPEGEVMLGADDAAYRVESLARQDEVPRPERYFLGEDGTLYRAEELRHDGSKPTPTSSAEGVGGQPALERGGYFLGADGAIYEVIE